MFAVKPMSHQYQDEQSTNANSRPANGGSLPSFSELLTSIPLAGTLRTTSTTSSAVGSPYIQYNGISSPIDHRRYSNSTPPVPSLNQTSTSSISASSSTSSNNSISSYIQQQPNTQQAIIHPHPMQATMVVVNPTAAYQYQPYHAQLLPRQSSQQQVVTYQCVQPQPSHVLQTNNHHLVSQALVSLTGAPSTDVQSPTSLPLTLPTPPSSSNSHRTIVRSSSSSSISSDSATSPSGWNNESKRKHICKVCTRSFTTSGHLARHNRIHTGERKHICPWPTCEARFARQDNCMQHYKTHTNGKNKRAKVGKKPVIRF
ncbi:uncharacterized protein RJT21DRAFT_120686 [Scheffersomyces amazonensis]|uniref:uncharacterized protein n=1 Tax=Scheffersomyces amazonensis TaxID=1078765 RepID=UPI00315D06AA